MNDDDREDTAALRTYAALLAIILSAMALNTCSTRHAHGQDVEVRPETLVVEEAPTERPCCEDARPVVATDAIEWNDSTRLALGQCLVAEARWRNRTEHSIIAHTLERRWRRYNAHHPDALITYEQQVRQFCHLHRVPAADSANGWALNLPWGPMVEAPSSEISVRQWADDWDFTRETVGMFERGELRDPMPLAMTFGGDMDSGGVGLVYLGPWTHSIEDGAQILLHNRFYALASSVRRTAARRGAMGLD